MICEKCGKNTATTHIKTVVNGVIKEINLCGFCAADEGYTNISHNSILGIWSSMLSEAKKHQIFEDETKCPICNATFRSIAETGKVGCAQCYETFYKELLPYLKRVHGIIHHVGKIPNKAPLTVVRKKERVDGLRMELNRLISEEKYEEAAVIRDKIKQIEVKGNE